MAPQNGAGTGHDNERAWVTLLTRPSYLPGVITLAYSLQTNNTSYPLIVLTTPSLPQECIRALECEASCNPLLIIHPIAPLLLPDNQKTTLIASRFEDTWTKLRAFELTKYDTCVFLDADITIYKNMDEIFDLPLPAHDWIAACHSCVCNLDHDPWAAEDWSPQACAYTPLSHPSSLHQTTSPPPPPTGPPHPHALLNGGVFLYHPSPQLWTSLLEYFNTSPALQTYQFPDQDFLADFFMHKWRPLAWRYNAIKTMQNWHRNIWRDDEVQGLHYIVDKPWQKRVASDGVAGYLGRDGLTHGWWWAVYERWCRERDDTERGQGEEGRRVMAGLVAAELNPDADRAQCEENREKGFPRPIPGLQNDAGVAKALNNEVENGKTNGIKMARDDTAAAAAAADDKQVNGKSKAVNSVKGECGVQEVTNGLNASHTNGHA